LLQALGDIASVACSSALNFPGLLQLCSGVWVWKDKQTNYSAYPFTV